jgi:citrate lyase beta subunit
MTMRSLSTAELEPMAGAVRDANLAFARRYPGESAARQPVHTVYGGAQHFRRDVVAAHRDAALLALDNYAPTAETFAEALGLPADGFAGELYERVLEKLRREPVEDFRIDFEDGYGHRPDAEEDAAAALAACEVAAAMEAGALPPFIGLRLKSLLEETRERAVATLDVFVTTLLAATGGRLPSGFVVTLPKVTVPEQVSYFCDVLDVLEPRVGLARGALRFEVMVEAPQAVLGARGESPLPLFLAAARGRLSGVHFGTYDYTSGVGITAAYQGMRHAACDHARHAMQVAFAGTGVWLSDGSTAVLPVPIHHAGEGGPLTPDEARENRAAVHRAWRAHFDDVRHSLAHGFYQGWDLHPAQLPTRYAAVFAFFLAARDAAALRLRGFLEKASRAGDAFDDPHAGQALLNLFLRGIASGAFTEAEVAGMTGLTPEELAGRSFAGVLHGRQG